MACFGLVRKHLSSLQNPIVKESIKLRDHRKFRFQQKKVFVEGLVPILEVCEQTSWRPTTVFVSDSHPLFSTKVPEVQALLQSSSSRLRWPDLLSQTRVFSVSDGVMRKISDLESPSGVAAIFEMPEPSPSLAHHKFVLVLDGISDPGNMGTLIRTATGLGWNGAFVLNSSVDPFNQKAVRASMGAVFKLPLQLGSVDTLNETFPVASSEWLAADANGLSAQSYLDKQKNEPQPQETRPRLLILGNERHGVSPMIKSMSQSISIPMAGPMESLNVAVAGGMLMHVLGPQVKL